MPIYEYETVAGESGCDYCQKGFEILQSLRDAPPTHCPRCGAPVKRILSWCRAAVVERSEAAEHVERKIAAYEKDRMWSHAAELADRHAERTGDPGWRTRSFENYKKAGYDPDRMGGNG